MKLATVRPRARLDLLDQFVYLGEQASIEAAERYHAAVAETCKLLFKQPRSGSVYRSGILHLKGMRRMPVKGFEKFMMFYLPTANGVDIVRVLHGARNIQRVFAEDEA